MKNNFENNLLLALGIPSAIYAVFLLAGSLNHLDVRNTKMFAYFVVFTSAFFTVLLIKTIKCLKTRINKKVSDTGD